MQTVRSRHWLPLTAMAVVMGSPAISDAADGFFSAKNTKVVQLAEQAFLTWDPRENVETLTIQPRFQGNALDFGLVIPTPSRPKVDTDATLRNLFKHLAVYTTLKQRAFPASRLVPDGKAPATAKLALSHPTAKAQRETATQPAGTTVVVLDAGAVGAMKYQVIEAQNAGDLFKWLKDKHYDYAGDEATLNHYLQKKWVFTVMKIDARTARHGQDSTFTAELTPIRLQFASEQLVYPLKITQGSVRDKTDVVFYVQAPYKVDLPGAHSYQSTWVPMLEAAKMRLPGGLPDRAAQWLATVKEQHPALLQRGRDGHPPTVLQWARRLTDDDIKVATGEAPYSEKLPDVDDGFTADDLKNPKRTQAVKRTISDRAATAQKERTKGYLLRQAAKEDVQALQQLAGQLQSGMFLTRFQKTFTRGEMNDDLLIVPARYGDAVDESEYVEMLPAAPK